MNIDIKERLFKKVEHLNSEFESRLTKVREHYETQWRQKSDDFITEIAENKIRINELLEARDALLKKTMTGADNSNLEQTITLYKQYLVAKDCELDDLRAKYKEETNQIFALKTQLEEAIRSHERVIVEMS
jgi:DNA-binding transcriptional regulator YbjK